MKYNRLFALAVFFSLLSQISNSQEKAIRKKLTGNWEYLGLEYPKSAHNYTDEVKTAGARNKGKIISFTADGKYQIWKLDNNEKTILISGKLVLTKGGKHLAVRGLEGDIQTLDKQYLKLYYPGHPIIIFSRL